MSHNDGNPRGARSLHRLVPRARAGDRVEIEDIPALTRVAAGSHAVTMMFSRLREHGSARRLAAVDAFQFPSGARQRFGFEHETMNAAGIHLVEDATRQWFRLAARHPKARLAMPSVAVDAMWHEVTLHTREYDAFCAGAFGHPLHHIPASSVKPESIGPGLSAAYRLACEDEPSDGHSPAAAVPGGPRTRHHRRPSLPRRLRWPVASATSCPARDACGTWPVRRDRGAKAGGHSRPAEARDGPVGHGARLRRRLRRQLRQPVRARSDDRARTSDQSDHQSRKFSCVCALNC